MSTEPELPRLSPATRAIFAVVAMLLPFVAATLLEGALRLGGFGRGRSLFVPAPFDSARYLAPNPRFAARYFPGDPSPPTPPADAFLRQKPSNGFRIFVLGESTTAGFPFPANGTFSRVLRDALADALPDTHVEVVNVGIPATNSFALIDELPEVLEWNPDAVLIYAGHNEYYGAMGSASTVRLGGNPSLVRFVLELRRLRVVQLLERGIARLGRPTSPAEAGVSRMEELAAGDTLRLGGPGYRAGVDQFRSNLDVLLGRLRDAGVPAYVGTLASNLRDQPPFASDSGSASTNAAAAFVAAHALLDARDPGAESLFVRARDLDLIRFRAPSEFNGLVREAARLFGATHVGVAEALHDASPQRVPGDSLFFEHVHPRPRGTVLMARAYFDALAANGFHGRGAGARPVEWQGYEARMSLTSVDTAIAATIVAALRHRWPFVPRGSGSNYLATYAPRTAVDSQALLVVTGRQSWVQAKLAMAARHEQRGQFGEAIAEYRGLMRDQPWNESPFRFGGRAALAANRLTEALAFLERAYALEPTPFTCLALGRLVAADSTQIPRAITLVQQSQQLGGFNPEATWQLSLMHARVGNVAAARAAAASLYRLAPSYPGLADWMRLLGMR